MVTRAGETAKCIGATLGTRGCIQSAFVQIGTDIVPELKSGMAAAVEGPWCIDAHLGRFVASVQTGVQTLVQVCAD